MSDINYYSLNGYLILKSKTALSLLNTSKRLWFVFNESSCELVSYLCEKEFNTNPALFTQKIDISRCAIVPNNTQELEFKILSSSSNLFLKAETPEAYEIWIRELQKKRDNYNKIHLRMITEQYSLDTNEFLRDLEFLHDSKRIYESGTKTKKKQGLKKLEKCDKKIESGSSTCSISSSSSSNLNVDHEPNKNLSRKKSSTLKKREKKSLKKEDFLNEVLKCESELSENDEDNNEKLINSVIYESRTSQSFEKLNKKEENLITKSSEIINDLIEMKELSQFKDLPSKIKKSLKLNDASAVSSLSSHNRWELNSIGSNDSAFYDINELTNIKMINDKNINNNNNNSDGCLHEIFIKIGKGISNLKTANFNNEKNEFANNNSQNLEAELLALKAQLAMSKDKELNYEKLLYEKDLEIMNLKKQLKEIESSTDNKEKSIKLNQIYQEKLNDYQNQMNFLKNEISNLNSILYTDEKKFKELKNLCKILKDELNNFKKDYLLILQSFLAMSIEYEEGLISNPNSPLNNTDPNNGFFKFNSGFNVANLSTKPVLFGANKHKERLRRMLEESRKIDPTLPSWQSLTSDGAFIDKHGFKYNKQNEAHLTHYVCQQLSLFYASRANFLEDQAWKMKIKQWKKEFVVNKEVKSLIRNGISSRFRSQIWKIFIDFQVNEIKENKGPNYYSYLCSVSDESPVCSFFVQPDHYSSFCIPIWKLTIFNLL